MHRDDLAAAHARVAQLERELADMAREDVDQAAEVAALRAMIEQLENPSSQLAQQRADRRRTSAASRRRDDVRCVSIWW